VPANARLGALVVLSIVNCMAVTLFVLPAILHMACRFGARSAVDETTDAVLPRGESQA
jgi:predicted RND superfamily exporter protein